MTKREQYELTFLRYKNPTDGSFKNICRRDIVNNYSELQFIDRLDQDEINSLIASIDNAQNGLYFQEIFCTDSVEDEDIEIHPPNVIINTICILPMADMKLLLQEWLAFINE